MTATGPIEHACHVCGAADAPYGFGWPGPAKGRGDDTFLWACPVHREAVEAINGDRVGRSRPR